MVDHLSPKPAVRHPRDEATALLPDGYEARVLEPSPPANTDPDWYADDPTHPRGGHATVVSPVSDGDLTWDEHVRSHPELADFAAARWLGAWKWLPKLPEAFGETRDALHQVAFFALAPRRYASTSKLGLRWTYRGLGTPFYGEDEQVRVEAGLLIHQTSDEVRATEVTTVTDACRFLGLPYEVGWFEDFHDPLDPIDPDTPLEVDPEAAMALGDWFGFTTSVLEELRRTPGAVDVSRVQLWPEHFDPAVELGSAEAGQRASYGASPGDSENPEPYLYVSPWAEVDTSDPYWNGGSFGGALLGFSELVSSSHARASALAFYREGYRQLAG